MATASKLKWTRNSERWHGALYAQGARHDYVLEKYRTAWEDNPKGYLLTVDPGTWEMRQHYFEKQADAKAFANDNEVEFVRIGDNGPTYFLGWKVMKRNVSTKIVERYYPVAHHVDVPRSCSRCAHRVFSYATVQLTRGNKTIDEQHFCPPCDRQRHND